MILSFSRNLVQRVTRPATLRRGSQIQSRFIHPLESQLGAPRSNTWLAKLRFRPDGKPRSKLIALGFGSLILFNSISFLTLFNTFKNGLDTHTLLEKMIFVQGTDAAYDSIDFDDFISTLSYFKKLCRPFSWMSGEETDKHFDELTRQIITRAKKGSEKSIQVQAQHVMRSAAEKIHGAFRELNEDSIGTTAKFVKFVIHEAWIGLAKLLPDDDDDVKSSPKYALQLDAGVSKDFEVLG